MTARLLLLLPTSTYRTADFLNAVRGLRFPVEVVVAAERRNALEPVAGGRTVRVDFSDVDRSFEAIAPIHSATPFHSIIASDDTSCILAAELSARFGLRHNPPAAVRTAANKLRMRERLAAAGVPGPRFEHFGPNDSPEAIAAHIAQSVGFPCVLKPVALSASRGVIRADHPGQAADAARRIRAILASADPRPGDREANEVILVESYLDGDEVALEGLLTGGSLRVLALFDKPDPLPGPFFEETLLVTPSRHPRTVQRAVQRAVERAVDALGLTHGPVHAEVRLTAAGPRLLEVAARSIGGLCSRALRFRTGVTLEQLIVHNDLDLPVSPARERRAAGVMMIPIPGAGVLRAVGGLDAARAVEGIESIDITHPIGQPITPLPEGNRYLGFIFARADGPDEVEATLRNAHRHLEVSIAPVVDSG